MVDSLGSERRGAAFLSNSDQKKEWTLPRKSRAGIDAISVLCLRAEDFWWFISLSDQSSVR